MRLTTLISTLILMSSVSATAHADSIQSCLDQLSIAAAKKRAAVSKSTRETLTFTRVEESELTNRCDEQGDLNAIKKALSNQIARCSRTEPMDKPSFRLGCRTFNRANWCMQTSQRMLEIANSSPNFSTYLNRIRAEFDWYKSDGRLDNSTDGAFQRGDMQFTGYYTPVIKASRVRIGSFQHAVYSTPPDLVQIPDGSRANCGVSRSRRSPMKWCRKNRDGSFSPYFTRGEIELGALRGRGLEIAYVEDPVDLAFMMVQGSGTLEIQEANGTKKLIRANFGGMNGRTLQMLGRVVRCAGGEKNEYSSMDGIKSFLRARPEKTASLMNYDQSYVFFREEAEGPLGSEDVPVVARHSLAVDRRLIPPGSSILIDVEKSRTDRGGSCPRVTTFAMAHDTGGAIKGAHVDWYLGAGKQAGDLAGQMNNAGALYVAVLRGSGTRVANCSE